MACIALEGMIFTGPHGYYPEERKAGNRFRVDVYIDTPATGARQSDKLEGTVDYGRVYDLVRAEMQTPAKLIEHLAQRILTRFEKDHQKTIRSGMVEKVTVRVTKFRPPVSGYLESASFSLSEEYSSE